jgi:hypothetical protein
MAGGTTLRDDSPAGGVGGFHAFSVDTSVMVGLRGIAKEIPSFLRCGAKI